MEPGSIREAWRSSLTAASTALYEMSALLSFLDPLHLSAEYRSRPFRIALDRSKQVFSRHCNARIFVQLMCCIEQTHNSLSSINTTAPPASQNLVKGGSP